MINLDIDVDPQKARFLKAKLAGERAIRADLFDGAPTGKGRLTELSWSEDGDKLACFKLGRRRFPGADWKATVLVMDLVEEQVHELGKVAFHVLHDATVERSDYLSGPPQWSPDGSWLLVTDAEGVTQFHLNGEHRRLVEQKDTLPVRLAPDGNSFVFAKGESLFLAGIGGLDLLDIRQVSASFKAAVENDIVAYAYSPDGARLAVSAKRHLIMLELGTFQAEAIHRADEEICQIEWLPQADCLVVVSGTKGIASWGMGATPSLMRGRSRWTVIDASGENDRKCLEVCPLDPRDAWFDIASGGRLVATTRGLPLRPTSRCLMIGGLGACREIKLKCHGKCAYPVWRPEGVSE